MKNVFGLFAAAVIGAAVAAGLWWAVDLLGMVNDVGLLERQPWPLSDVVICSGAGAACGVMIVLFRYWRRRRHATELADLAGTMGLEFHAEVARSDVEAFTALRVIQKFWAGRNRLSGVVNGVPIEMIDYTYLFQLRGAGTGNQLEQPLYPDDRSVRDRWNSADLRSAAA